MPFDRKLTPACNAVAPTRPSFEPVPLARRSLDTQIMIPSARPFLSPLRLCYGAVCSTAHDVAVLAAVLCAVQHTTRLFVLKCCEQYSARRSRFPLSPGLRIPAGQEGVEMGHDREGAYSTVSTEVNLEPFTLKLTLTLTFIELPSACRCS